jgi:hypothetical protein
MAAAQKKQTGFDLGKLEKMSPPFTIRIERRDVKTQQREPIPLPQDVWSMEDAKKIEQIVLNDVSGGGSYKGQISDQQGNSMEWDFVFPTDFFPPKIAPGSEGAAAYPMPVSPAMAARAAAMQPVNGGGWMPGMYGSPMAPPTPTMVPAYQPPAPGYPGAQMASPYQANFGGPPWWGYQAPPASTPRASSNDPEMQMLRQQLDAFKQQAAEERHLREREQAEARHAQELAAMRNEMRDLAAASAAQSNQLRESLERRPRGDEDPAVLALKAQMEEVRRANEQLQRDRDREVADNRHREELRAAEERSQRQIDALKESIMANKVDPTMQMFMEMQRQQADVQREASRLSADQAREASRLASEQPRMVMDMMKQAKDASGADQVLGQLSRAYEGVMNVQNRVMETMANMQGSPGWEMAGNALEAGREALNKFISAKQSKDLAAERTAQYKMQTEAYAVQAAAAAQAAQQDPYRYADGSIKGQSPERVQIAGAEPVEAEVESDEDEDDDEPKEKQPHERTIFGPI